jgi:hypothetical protein
VVCCKPAQVLRIFPQGIQGPRYYKIVGKGGVQFPKDTDPSKWEEGHRQGWIRSGPSKGQAEGRGFCPMLKEILHFLFSKLPMHF